jgi:HSP20 family molecular chaperone IbpA
MPMIKWTLYNELDPAEHHFPPWLPAADVHETEDEYVVTIDTEHARATFSKGVLEIRMPKSGVPGAS